MDRGGEGHTVSWSVQACVARRQLGGRGGRSLRRGRVALLSSSSSLLTGTASGTSWMEEEEKGREASGQLTRTHRGATSLAGSAVPCQAWESAAISDITYT